MKCSNCQERDHRQDAKYCHVCGTRLHSFDLSSLVGHLQWLNIKTQRKKSTRKTWLYSKLTGRIYQWLSRRLSYTGNVINSHYTPRWLYEETCKKLHLMPGYHFMDMKWSQAIRYILLFAVFIECIILSVTEFSMYEPWGQVTIVMVNMLVFANTLAVCVSANVYDMYGKKKTVWKLYYHWLHFLLAALLAYLGYLLVSNVQNFLTLILNLCLGGIILMMDSGSVESITNDS